MVMRRWKAVDMSVGSSGALLARVNMGVLLGRLRGTVCSRVGGRMLFSIRSRRPERRLVWTVRYVWSVVVAFLLTETAWWDCGAPGGLKWILLL